MSEQRVLPVQVEFCGIRCSVVRTTYLNNDSPALLLTDAEDGSPVTTATANVPGVSDFLPEGITALKTYAENEGLLEALEAAGVVEDTGERVHSRFVEFPIVRLLY